MGWEGLGISEPPKACTGSTTTSPRHGPGSSSRDQWAGHDAIVPWLFSGDGGGGGMCKLLEVVVAVVEVAYVVAGAGTPVNVGFNVFVPAVIVVVILGSVDYPSCLLMVAVLPLLPMTIVVVVCVCVCDRDCRLGRRRRHHYFF